MTRLVLVLIMFARICSAQTNIPGDYPQASTQLLSKEDIKDFDATELLIMRNEIFARYGHIFKNKELREHFSMEDWYKPRFPDVTARLTETEKANVQLILAREKWLQPVPVNKLPMLSLPLDLERSSFNDISEVVGITPHFTDKSPAAIVGMLADTSKYYAVLWYIKKLAIIPDSPPIVYYLTTYNKKLTEIATALVSLPIGGYDNPGATDCANTNFTHSSYINQDLSYSSNYSFNAKCPGDTEPQLVEFGIAGQIKKDGTIVVSKNNSPY